MPTLPAGRRLILEIHEEAVPDIGLLRQLRDQLAAHGVGLAYDDFGAGQSRLTELAEVPPDYIKLDMRLVRDIHYIPQRHLEDPLTRDSKLQELNTRRQAWVARHPSDHGLQES